MTINAPIRYFGGKGNMINKILSHFPANYETFVDVYGGAGTVLFNKPYCSVEVYNDLEQNVYTFYKVLKDKQMFADFKFLCDFSVFSEQQSQDCLEQLNRDDLSDVDRAFAFFYVNRTRRGGGLGGMAINTVVRRNMSKSASDFLSAVDRLEEFHFRLSSVIVMNRDALDLIPFWDKPGVLMYLDPPYVHSTRTSARYLLDCDDTHHKGLVDTLLRLKNAKVCLSGYENSLYAPLEHAGWTKSLFNVDTVSSTNRPKTKTEGIWTNYDPNS